MAMYKQQKLTPSQSLPARWKGYVLGFITVFVLGFTIFPLNFLQCLSVLLLPFSPQTFRRINEYLAGLWWRLCVYFFENFHRVKVVRTGDVLPPKENALVISNHQQMPDIVVLLALAKHHQRLGQLKWFVKDPIKYVPGIGWGMLFIDCFFVKRNWTQDESTIQRTFRKIIKNRIPLWLLSFLEGTRITEPKLRKVQEYARKQSWPLTRYVLLPRTKGFIASVQGLRQHLDAVYDVTIGYPHGVPSLWQLVQGLCKEIHLDTRRFAIGTLPLTAQGLDDWARERFYEKDFRMHCLYEQGSFPSTLPKTQTL